MKEMLLELIGIAMLQTVVMLFAGNDSTRKTIQLVGGVSMTLVLLSSVMRFDFSAYSSALWPQQEQNAWSSDFVREKNDRLNRLLIEEECAAYILDKARELNVELLDASVGLSWSTNGYWYPSQAVLVVPKGTGTSAQLADVIQTQLGVPLDAQTWREDDTTDGSE